MHFVSQVSLATSSACPNVKAYQVDFQTIANSRYD